MNPIIRNVFAVIGGIAIGTLVNLGIISLSPFIIPPPEGMDPNNAESIAEFMPLLQSKHFILPFLAHALGTLVGAFVSAKFSVSHPKRAAFLIGFFFLFGGIMASTMIPAPAWFIGVDLILAYLPMAYLGAKLAGESDHTIS